MRISKPTGGLWAHRDFMKLWTGQSISEFGSQISQLAIPLLALYELNATTFEFAVLGVLGFMPFILFALPAGVWVDRLRRRPILIVGDASRAILLGLIPILWAMGVLEIWQLFVITFVIGIFTVFFDVAYQSYLPALIERDDLVDGNSKIQLTVSVAQVAGPASSGALIGAVTAPYAILFDAVSFVVSSVFMVSMRHRENVPERPKEGHPKMWPQVKEGLQWVVGHRWLRWIATCTGTSNFFNSLFFAVLLVYVVRVLHFSATEIGVMFAVGSLGSIVGALLANRIQKRIGVGPAIVLGSACFCSTALIYVLAPQSGAALPIFMIGQAIGGFGGVSYNITQVSLRQAITPERLQGRMNAAMRWIVWGTIPLGALLGGAIGQWIGLRTAMWIGAIGDLTAFLPVALTSVRSIREMPASVEQPTPAQAELQGGLIGGEPLPAPASADL
jgi:MFS family permease